MGGAKLREIWVLSRVVSLGSALADGIIPCRGDIPSAKAALRSDLRLPAHRLRLRMRRALADRPLSPCKPRINEPLKDRRTRRFSETHQISLRKAVRLSLPLQLRIEYP